jgi:tryptophan synthase
LIYLLKKAISLEIFVRKKGIYRYFLQKQKNCSLNNFIHLFYSLSYIPLIAPSTPGTRILHLARVADTFIYVVSRMGVTGSGILNEELPIIMAKIRQCTKLPLAVGFGITTREHFKIAGSLADGVVIGSKIINVLKSARMFFKANYNLFIEYWI